MRASADLIGYRLRDAATIDWPAFTMINSATFTGLLVQAYFDPEAVLAQRRVKPFGSSLPASWSIAELSIGNLFFGAAEPDPRVAWDAARLAQVAGFFEHIDGTLGGLWFAGDASAESVASSSPADA